MFNAIHTMYWLIVVLACFGVVGVVEVWMLLKILFFAHHYNEYQKKKVPAIFQPENDNDKPTN